MRTFSSAAAKNQFGRLIDAARLEPVAVTKYDRPFVVVLAIEEFEKMVSHRNLSAAEPEIKKKS